MPMRSALLIVVLALLAPLVAWAEDVAEMEEDVDAQLALAIAAATEGRFEEAALRLEQITERHPDCDFAWLAAADIHAQELKRFARAKELYEEAVKRLGDDAPTSPACRVERGDARLLPPGPSRVETRRRLAEEQARERALRRGQQEQSFALLIQRTERLRALLEQAGGCPGRQDAEALRSGALVLEQVELVVEGEEVDMASDVIPYVNEAVAEIEAVRPACAE